MAKFAKGQTGNRAGKPRGAKDKRTELRALLDPHKEALAAKVVELALGGDTTALRICIDRLMPALRPIDGLVDIRLSGATLTEKAEQILEAVGAGRVSPDQGARLLDAIAACAKLREADDLDRRIRVLESEMRGEANRPETMYGTYNSLPTGTP